MGAIGADFGSATDLLRANRNKGSSRYPYSFARENTVQSIPTGVGLLIGV